ncbi:MAG: hypothetical protein PF517_10035 [Salinivirgaceae bacterium]|jgi:hypothetical protein|nr:hypothetical protein [Salinivirgaceae bacterium]
MKKLTQVFTLVMVMFLISSTISNAQSKNKVRKMEYNSSYNYEVATVAVGVDGTKLVKVWGYGKKPEDAIRNAKELGIACAIFRGFPPASNGRAAKTPAIVTDSGSPEKNAAFFETFFAPGGKYLQYVNLSTDAPPSGADRLKVNRKTYKVGITVSIAFDELRKYLEEQGIARSLNSGF